MYTELPASAPLKSRIKCLWHFEAPAGAAGAPRHRSIIVPDNCIDIVFDFSADAAPMTAFVVGMMSKPFVSTHSRVLGVRFRAGAFRTFCGIGAAELTDRHVGLADLEPRLWRTLRRVFDTGFDPARLATIDALLLETASRAGELDARMRHAVGLIEMSRGRISIAAASRELGMSRQHFRRRFLDAVGLSPKTFARICRLDAAVSEARAAERTPNLAEFAAAHGFADQAHLTRDFAALTCRTPGEFFSASSLRT